MATGVSTDTPIMGTEKGQEFSRIILEDLEEMDFALARRDVTEAAKKLVQDHPEVGAIVFKCTNMSPYAGSVQKATGLPVITPFAFVCWFQSMPAPKPV